MKVLGIETSCDDTGVCLIEANGSFGADLSFKILGNAQNSQAAIHAQYGGVFPSAAKKEHVKNLPLLLEKVLSESGGAMPDIIAVTVGPGLEPCLWTGITFAQKLAAEWRVPIVGVNHMEGHIMMSMTDLRNPSLVKFAEFEFPALALLISGGHTELVLMREFGQYEILGQTRDDAVGEAFDKVARMLGLPYPGGPHVSRLAEEARSRGDALQIAKASPLESKLPRPMLNDDNYDFSFAGLKTAVRRVVENRQGKALPIEEKQQLAREFEDAAADVLVAKTLRAVEEHGARVVVLGGGVSANKHIRAELARQLAIVGCQLLVCPPEWATDNALMIALAGYFHALKKEFNYPSKLAASGTLSLDIHVSKSSL